MGSDDDQSSTDSAAIAAAGGIAGVRANAPPIAGQTPKPIVTPAPQLAGRSTETTNFEVSKLTRHTIALRGDLERLSVAVILDDQHTTAKDAQGNAQAASKSRSAADMERIRGLVAAAVGLDTERGDQLTVENIAFDEAPVEDIPAPGWMQRLNPVKEYAPMAIRLLVVLIVVAAGFFGLLRPMVRATFPAPVLLPAAAVPVGLPQVARTVEDLEGEIEAELDASTGPPSAEARRLPVLTKRIAKRADAEPEQVARLVRSWLVEEER